MSATALLHELHVQGVEIRLADGRLKLSASVAPPDELIARLQKHKAELITILMTQPRWDAQDWRDYYEERAAIAEHDGHLARAQAERLAYLHCRLEWADHSPPPDPGEGLCVHCREPLGEQVRTITTTAGERHLHTSCEDRYAAGRARMAKAALAEAGIEHPPDE